MDIHHRPQFDTSKVIEHYSNKDGVDIKYVCSTEITADDVVIDVYYRETPHPEFGNKYFGLYRSPHSGHLMITNADKIEEMTIEAIMPEGFDQWHYSQCRHDYYTVGNVAIDGGRAYTKLVGDMSNLQRNTFSIKDGEMVTLNKKDNELGHVNELKPENGF